MIINLLVGSSEVFASRTARQTSRHILYITIKTAILSWLQNDGSRGFSIDQLKGNNLC